MGSIRTPITGGGGTPSDPDTSVQYNDSGAFAGDSTFTFDDVLKIVELQNLQVDNSAVIEGNLTVNGSIVSINSESLNVGDNHIYLNAADTSASAATGGIVVNIGATGLSDAVTAGAFTAGVLATSNATVITDGSATFATNDIIQLSAFTQNNGIFEVLSHSGTTLTIRGVGITPTVEDWTNNDFITETDTGVINKVNVAVLLANDASAGQWSQATGNETSIGSPFVFEPFVTENIYTSDGTITGSRIVSAGTTGTIIVQTFDGVTLGASTESSLLALSAFNMTLEHEDLGTTDIQALSFTNSGGMLVTDTINTQGLIYSSDYSANWTARSLVDKDYVDTHPGHDPAGADTQIQFNDNGVFGADAKLTFDSTTDILALENAQITVNRGTNTLGTFPESQAALHTRGFAGANKADWYLDQQGDSAFPKVHFRRSAQSTTNNIVEDGEEYGEFVFWGWDGAEYKMGASFTAEVDGTPGLGDMPGRLVFYTTPTGTSIPQPRLTITQDGKANYSADVSAGATDRWLVDKEYVDTHPGHDPAGSDTQIQFNNAGAFGADAKHTWIDATARLVVGDGTGANTEAGVILIDRAGATPSGAAFPTSRDAIRVKGTASVRADIGLDHISDTAGTSGMIQFRRARDAGLVVDGDQLGGIDFDGHDGTGFITSATIEAVVDGTAAEDDMPTRLDFRTVPDGSQTLITRMSIKESGDLDIGTGFWTWDNTNHVMEVGIGGNSGSTSGTVAVRRAQSSLSTFPDASAAVHTMGGNSTRADIIVEDRSDGATNAGMFAIRRSRITGDVPQENDQLGEFATYGWDGDNWRLTTLIRSEITAAVTGSDPNFQIPGSLEFFVTPSGTTIQEKMRLQHDGNLGIGTTSPASLLDVNGSFAVLRVASGASNVSTDDEVIIGVTDTAAARTVTIQTADIVDGRMFIIKDESGGAGTNNITVATQGSETIDGQSTIDIIVDYGVLRLYSNGINLFAW